MEKEFLTDKEAICLYITFILGTSLVIGIGSAENDAWLAGIAGILMSAPMLAIYARIISLFPGQNLYDISVAVFGKIAGRVVAVIYTGYAFHLGALVLRNFGEFIKIEALPETPLFVSIFCMGIVTVVAARRGIEVMARTTTFFLPLVFALLAAVLLLSIPQIHLNNLKPFLGHGIKPVLTGVFSTFSFPCCESVIFMALFSALKTKKSPFKVFKVGMLISGFVIVIVSVRNIGVLGSMLSSFNFPSYEAVSRIRIDDFIERIEVSVSFVFFMGVLFKGAACLLAASKGVARLFNMQDYRPVVIQVGLLMIYFAYTIYENSMQMRQWAFKTYSYYAFPMQVIIPVALWLTAEYKTRRKTQNAS